METGHHPRAATNTNGNGADTNVADTNSDGANIDGTRADTRGNGADDGERTETNSKRVEDRKTRRHHIDLSLIPSPHIVRAIAGLGICIWFVIFVVGLLVPSFEYRGVFMPRDPSKVGELTTLASIPTFGATVVLIKASLTFSPINIGLLCIVAGLVGGCAANLNWYNIERVGEADRISARRSVYLTEHPANAVLRSFLIYLLLMAGLLAFLPDPFKLLEPPGSNKGAELMRELAIQQGFYSRLAALASVLSFMVGYDPSRFDGLFELIPGLGKTAKSKESAQRDG